MNDVAEEFTTNSTQEGVLPMGGDSLVIAEDGSKRKISRVSPIAGFGVGVPLSRLYAEYLGGSLIIETIHGEGTVATLTLKRCDAGSGEVLSKRPETDLRRVINSKIAT